MSDLQDSVQITSESPSNQGLIAGQVLKTADKPLKGKYDGRGKWKRTAQNTKGNSKPGPKPLHIKNLARNSASKVLVVFDAIASLSQIYAAAFERGDLKLCVEMRENALNRAYGRPYQAQDPNASKKPNVLEDKRLQIAIKELHVDAPKALKGETR